MSKGKAKERPKKKIPPENMQKALSDVVGCRFAWVMNSYSNSLIKNHFQSDPDTQMKHAEIFARVMDFDERYIHEGEMKRIYCAPLFGYAAKDHDQSSIVQRWDVYNNLAIFAVLKSYLEIYKVEKYCEQDDVNVSDEDLEMFLFVREARNCLLHDHGKMSSRRPEEPVRYRHKVIVRGGDPLTFPPSLHNALFLDIIRVLTSLVEQAGLGISVEALWMGYDVPEFDQYIQQVPEIKTYLERTGYEDFLVNGHRKNDPAV